MSSHYSHRLVTPDSVLSTPGHGTGGDAYGGKQLYLAFAEAARVVLLSLGLTNDELFRNIMSFSPGLMVPNVRRGKPAVYMSHGTADTVLPIDTNSRVFAPTLQSLNYPVTYREFGGRHQLPAAVSADAFRWVQASWSLVAT